MAGQPVRGDSVRTRDTATQLLLSFKKAALWAAFFIWNSQCLWTKCEHGTFWASQGLKRLMFGGLTVAPWDIRPYHDQPR
jgi:hypothetical protein